jgi:PhnB protein
MGVKPIPDGYQTVNPYLMVEGASELIEFVKKAFEAVEVKRMNNPDNSVGHAAVRIGDSVLMMSDARGQWKPMPSVRFIFM